MTERIWSRTYAALMLTFGVCYAVVLPPFQGPDEITHYVRALGVSRGHCVATKYVDLSETDFTQSNIFHPLTERDQIVASGDLRKEILADLPAKRPGNDVPIPSIHSPDGYGCILYFPSASALAIVHPFHLSLIVNLLMARLANLVASLSILYFGLRIMPFGKPLYALVSLLPMFVSQIAAVSGDSLTNSVGMFAVAWILRLSSGEPTVALSKAETLGLAALAAVLALAKLDAFLILLVILIPRSRFGSFTLKATMLVMLLMVTFGTLYLWFHLNTDVNRVIVGQELSGRNIDVKQNVAYGVTHLGTVARVFAEMTKNNGKVWITETVGEFGWLVTSLPPWAVGAAVCCLVYLSSRVRWTMKPSLWMRLLTTAVALCGGLAMLGLTFSYEMTRTHLADIMQGLGTFDLGGVQGRYFLPFLMPLGLGLGTATADPDAEGFERILALSAGGGLNLLGLVTIAQYYYR